MCYISEDVKISCYSISVGAAAADACSVNTLCSLFISIWCFFLLARIFIFLQLLSKKYQDICLPQRFCHSSVSNLSFQKPPNHIHVCWRAQVNLTRKLELNKRILLFTPTAPGIPLTPDLLLDLALRNAPNTPTGALCVTNPKTQPGNVSCQVLHNIWTARPAHESECTGSPAKATMTSLTNTQKTERCVSELVWH